MAFEAGGRADKFGNRYETRWLVKQFLRLIKGEVATVVLEPIGEEEEGVDIRIKNLDNSLEFHQCKGRNASKEYWTLSDLNSKNIFTNAKKHLEANSNLNFYFVSAVSARTLGDLADRARNSNDNPLDYYNFQIKKSGAETNKAFEGVMKYFGLNVDNEDDLNVGFFYLKRLFMILYPDDINQKDELLDTIKQLYIGDPESIYSLIINYPLEKDMLGKEINTHMLDSYIVSNKNIEHRLLHKDPRILPTIEKLNNEFDSSFIAINDSIMTRKETESCFEEILKGNSVLLHGKAGTGKSGCIYELVRKLKENGIAYLSLKLDRRLPENTTEKYGENLGFSASPIHCLDSISQNKNAVIILDQLDAIRWTNTHSNTALEVCKDLIREVINMN